MKIITRQSCADEAIQKWEETYSSGRWGEDKLVILAKLKELPKPVNPDDIDRIIGNTSWTSPAACYVCHERAEVIVEMGDEPDYESRTAYLCPCCIRKAAKFVESL